MEIISIIQGFTQEESNAFLSYLRSKNKRRDTKNIALYKLLKKGTPLEGIDTHLYGKPNRNAYHALSKRLQDALIEFIATRSFETETSDDMQVFKYILTARIFYEQDQVTSAYYLLKKAIRRAQELELYTALTECYQTHLQYSHLHPEIDLQELTAKAQENLSKFAQQEQLNMAYAHIKKALTLDERLLKKGIQNTIEEIFTSFNITIDSTFTFKTLYLLLEIMNDAAHLDHNFEGALPFIRNIYSLIKQKRSIQTKQRFYHIQVLYIMANTHFRVRDFDQSETYLHLMKEEMEVNKARWAPRFYSKYVLIHTLLLNYRGFQEQAIQGIETYKKTQNKHPIAPDITLALSVYLTQQGSYKKALSTLNTLKHSDQWYANHVGIDWVIKKELLTLIIYYELEYIDLVQSLLRSFKRRHQHIIQNELRLANFMKVFTKLFNDPICLREDRFRESVKNHFTTSSLQNQDIFMLSFFAWIKSKLNASPLYETTLALL